MLTRVFQNEPNAIAGGFIALLAVVKALLRWGGIEVPAEVDTALQIAVGAWVGLFVRSQVAPVNGPQNMTVKAIVKGTGDGSINPRLLDPQVQ